MGNFASSAFCSRDASMDMPRKNRHTQKVRIGAPAVAVSTPWRLVDSLKAAITSLSNDMVSSLSGASVVISQLDEAWYQDLVTEVHTRKARCTATADASPAVFLGPSDTVVASIASLKFPMYTATSWSKSASNEDDDTSSCTTDETDDESKCDYSDCEASDDDNDSDDDDDDAHDESSCGCGAATTHQPEEVEYYKEDDDTETKADRLLRLASMSSSDVAPVYVEDYLCPCGECPQYARIACDVRTTVTWRGVKEQGSIIRVLQAFSTYNEALGYHPDMIEAAEECLQLWLGDEDRALNSFVMLYDEVPQLCAGQM